MTEHVWRNSGVCGTAKKIHSCRSNPAKDVKPAAFMRVEQTVFSFENHAWQ